MTRKRKRMLILSSVLAVTGAFVASCNWVVGRAETGRVYTDTNRVPSSRVAVVLGTAPLFGGAPNPYFTGRMVAAANLYKAGKVRKLLLSGTNDRVDYDEPTAMKSALMRLGVPESTIALDYAGRRTLDTVVRAKKVFGLDECVFVTDDFHMARTRWLADQNGVRANGFASESLPVSVSPITHVREIAARVMVVLDVEVLHTSPHFLGKREVV